MPILGTEIISTKPRPKSAHDFVGVVHCFIFYCVYCPPALHNSDGY